MTAINPFSTRCIRPGAVPFLFPEGVTAKSLVQQLGQQAWTGQIIGPHGTGKSTLVAALLPEIIAVGRKPIVFSLRDGIVTWPKMPFEQGGRQDRTVVIIDGFEQYRYWQRWWFRRQCQRVGSGLLVTAHQPIGFPNLHRTTMTPELATQVLSHLNRSTDTLTFPEDLLARLETHQGNLREALFDLYDLHEHRKRNRRQVLSNEGPKSRLPPGPCHL